MHPTIILAIADHLWRLLTFRHDGRGVPSALTPMLVWLIGVDVLFRIGLAWAQGLDARLQLVTHIAQLIIVYGLTKILLKRDEFAFVLLSVFVLLQLAFSAVWAVVLTFVLPIPEILQKTVQFWELVTLMITMTVVTRRLVGDAD